MSNGSREALIVVLSRRTRSRSEQKRVNQRFEANKCLMVLGDDTDCDCSTIDPVTGTNFDPSGRRVAVRGVCERCYNAFIYSQRGLTPEQCAAAEAEAVARGWILARNEGRRMKTRYAFGRLVS